MIFRTKGSIFAKVKEEFDYDKGYWVKYYTVYKESYSLKKARKEMKNGKR